MSNATAITRQDLLDWLTPGSEPTQAAFMYPRLRMLRTERAGSVATEKDFQRAILAWKSGTLAAETFATITQEGKRYTIRAANRLGIVLHRDGLVTRICSDFDDHSGDGGSVHAADTIATFLGTKPVRFTSRSGKGIHDFYELLHRKPSRPLPVPTVDFVKWAKGWGYNADGDVEVFPKTRTGGPRGMDAERPWCRRSVHRRNFRRVPHRMVAASAVQAARQGAPRLHARAHAERRGAASVRGGSVRLRQGRYRFRRSRSTLHRAGQSV